MCGLSLTRSRFSPTLRPNTVDLRGAELSHHLLCHPSPYHRCAGWASQTQKWIRMPRFFGSGVSLCWHGMGCPHRIDPGQIPVIGSLTGGLAARPTWRIPQSPWGNLRRAPLPKDAQPCAKRQDAPAHPLRPEQASGQKSSGLCCRPIPPGKGPTVLWHRYNGKAGIGTERSDEPCALRN